MRSTYPLTLTEHAGLRTPSPSDRQNTWSQGDPAPQFLFFSIMTFNMMTGGFLRLTEYNFHFLMQNLLQVSDDMSLSKPETERRHPCETGQGCPVWRDTALRTAEDCSCTSQQSEEAAALLCASGNPDHQPRTHFPPQPVPSADSSASLPALTNAHHGRLPFNLPGPG